MKKFILTFFILVSFTYGFDKVALKYGYKGSANFYGIALIENLNYKPFDIFNLSFEFSGEYAEYKNDDMYILSLQPLLDYNLIGDLYLEGGLGIAYLSEKYLDHKEFGMHFQFKESIGFLYKFNDKMDASLKYNHYSNANLNSKNSGIDFIGLQFNYKF
ncbi:acyloxyacyl hydrolase [Halarcobacter mediterraneus]|nr:acyloxyacyl hydrolase [Halarcobacter mediterraneus]